MENGKLLPEKKKAKLLKIEKELCSGRAAIHIRKDLREEKWSYGMRTLDRGFVFCV